MIQRINRRLLLQGAGALAGASAFPMLGSSARAAQGEVSILGIVPLTGPYAADGERIKRGQEMAIEDFNSRSTGLKINYVQRDAGGDAGVATRRVAEAIERENVVAIVGPWADDVSAAVSELALR
jgi:ABC-type branched-subunit amino acid transport system substrate-binding protein